MTKKLSVVALSLLATVLLSTTAFSQIGNNCSGGTIPVFIGVGSSAQTNTLSYAAIAATFNSFGTGTYNIYGTKSAKLVDTRFTDQPTDTGLTMWVVWIDDATTPTACDVYAYFQEDSTIGVRDFFAYQKSTASGNGCTTCVGQYGAVFGVTGSFSGASNYCPPGLTCIANLPLPIQTLLSTSPAPTSKTQLPPNYCGNVAKTAAATSFYCFFNAGGTDIRPEDALFATTRALSAYNTTNGLTGLGYAQTGCGSISTNEGCAFLDAFGQGKKFFTTNFALSGTDPQTKATLPAYQTLSDGLAPQVVLVSNNDTGTLGLGSTYSDSHGKSHYVFTDINRKVLASIFDGTTECTGAITPGTVKSGNSLYDNGFIGGPPTGAGQPLQVVFREELSGTYNTFEYTAVRIQSGGSANTAVAENKVSATTWLTQNDSGQELDINPASNTTTDAACVPTPNGSKSCGDPSWIQTPSHAGNTTSSACPGSGQVVPFRARAIGTGEEVNATLGVYNSTTSALTPGWKVSDGIGYTFWSYQNLAAAATTGTTPGHYLSVDGVDPFYITEGGEFDSQYGQTNNANGAFNVPTCNLSALPCTQINFPHVYDGKYPLWNQLRIVTFNPVSGQRQVPPGVVNMILFAEIKATDNTVNFSDFVPLLSGLTSAMQCPLSGCTTLPSGTLNVGVFRTHYLQSKVNPNNGHNACGGVFTGIKIGGGTGTCLVDVGGDVGGSVATIEMDDIFNKDFGSLFNSGKYELYGLHQ